MSHKRTATCVIMGCLLISAAMTPAQSPNCYPYRCCQTSAECGMFGHCEYFDCIQASVCVNRNPGLICIAVYEPVCGCDGITYSNECYAAQAGVPVAHPGVCAPSCADDSQCAPNQFCEHRGGCSGVTVCTARPADCFSITSPVCGCDGQTYRNECEAQQAGVSIASGGECPIACDTNEQCPSDQYCERSIGDCQSSGMCRIRLIQCADVWDPVCGCDGRTHRNSCEASRDGTTIAHFGPCATCQGNADCSQGEYCHKEQSCDGYGVCLGRPDACTEQWDPVCGCDGMTYSNACHAEEAGVNVAFAGPCAPPRADLDADYDVDEDDLQLFSQCKTGAAIHQSDPLCAAADMDLDLDVDQVDFGLFQRCLSGSGRPVSANCAN